MKSLGITLLPRELPAVGSIRSRINLDYHPVYLHGCHDMHGELETPHNCHPCLGPLSAPETPSSAIGRYRYPIFLVPLTLPEARYSGRSPHADSTLPTAVADWLSVNLLPSLYVCTSLSWSLGHSLVLPCTTMHFLSLL